jgi:peroxiredoxin
MKPAQILWIIAGVLVLLLGVSLFVPSGAKIPVGSPLDPNLGVADPSALEGLTIKKQEDHPVTPEMSKAADSLDAEKAPDFDLPSVDGPNYTLAQLTDGKPLLIFFIEKECPCCLGAKFFVDKMIDLYGDNLNAVGIINADGAVARAWKKSTKPLFKVLMDPGQKVIASYKAERGVYTTLIAPGGVIDKAYPGYSLSTLKEMSGRIAKLAGVPAKEFVSKAAPEKLTSGCAFPELLEETNSNQS